MKKVKVIFEDGSILEIPESRLQDAIGRGAKLYKEPSANGNRKISVKFEDGSTLEIPEKNKQAAIDRGATVMEASAEVKKKEDGTSLLGAAGAQTLLPTGTETTSIQPSGLVESGDIDLLQEGAMALNQRGVQPKAKPFTPVSTKPLILKPEEPEIAVNVNGTLLPISPNKVPEGYEKTVEGAKQYAQDISTSLRLSSIKGDQENYDDILNKVLKTSQLGKLNNNDATVSISDLAEINKLLGTNYTTVLPETLDLLNAKKEKIRLERSRLYADKPIKQFENNLKSNYDNLAIEKYIKKVGNSFQKEVDAGGEIGVLGADLRSDLQQSLSVVSDRYNNVEPVSNALATGIESLKFTDKAQYEILKDRLRSGKTFSTAKVAELTNIGARIIDARNLEQLERGELDINQYGAKTNGLTKILDDNFYKKPDILQRQVAQVIAKHYERNGTLAFGKWYVSDDEVDAVPQSEFVEAGIDFNRPEVKAAIKNIKKNEGILPFDNAISKDALIREFGRGFIQPVKGVTDLIGNIGASDNEKRIQQELQPLTDYEKQRGEYFNKHYGGIADAFSGAGQFISQYLMMEVGIRGFKGLGALAGGEAAQVVKAAESATPTAVRGGTKIGNYIIDKSQIWGQLAVPYLQTYDSYYKDALTKTDNSLAAKVGAFTNASMEALSEQMFNNVKFGREVIANFKNSALNVNRLAKMFDRGVFDAAAEKEFRQTMKDGLQNSIRAVAKGTKGLIEESFEEVPVQFSNFVVDAMLNPQSVKGRELLPELKDAFVSGLVSFSIPSILGVGGSLRQVFNNKGTGQDALMLAARNKGDVLDAIHNQVEDGELDHDEANKKIQLLNIAQASLKEVPKTDRNNTPLSEENKVKYLSLIVQGKYLEEENSKIKDDPVIKINDDKIKEINLQKSEILTPKEEPKSNIESAVIEINGKQYEGKNHAEAILKAKEDGQDISKVDRKAEGKFKLSDGTIISREESKKQFGADRSEQLIPQDEAAKQADKDYEKLTPKESIPSVSGENKLVITNEKVDIKDEVTDEKIGEREIKNFNINFPDGAKAMGYIENETAHITGINSAKDGITPKRGTKTFERVISQLRENGIKTIKIGNQSQDSRVALQKLVEQGVLENPRENIGISVDEHPSKFDISEQSQPKEQKADEKINQQGNEQNQPAQVAPISFRTDEQSDKIIKDADQLTVSQRALQRDIPDIVDPDKKKTSVKDLKNRYNALQELIVNCLR